jgi:hypothetical protein
VVNAYKRNGVVSPGSKRPDGTILIRNDTGGNLSRYSVVGLGASVCNPATKEIFFDSEIVLAGETPTLASHVGKFAILGDAIREDQVGYAHVRGFVQATVEVVDEAHGFADVTDGDPTKLTSNTTGNARIVWKESGTGTKRAIVELYRNHVSQIVRFRIKSGQTLAPLGTALARILTWDTDSGEWIEGDDDITVAEPYTAATGNFRAEGGYEGWCVFRAGTTYDIVEMEHVAQQITFTLDHALGYATAGQAEVTVTGVTNGRTPSADPVVVWDPNGHYPRTFAGAKGQAYYDIVNDRYVIFECEQLTLEIYATVTTLCVPSPSYPDDMLLNEAYMRAVPFGKHFFAMPETLPTTYANGLRNPFSFSAKSGDGALLRWDDNYEGTGEGRWIIIEVSKHTYDMITDVAVNEVTDGGTPVKILQKRTMKVQVYTCGDPAWEDIIDTTECPPPE